VSRKVIVKQYVVEVGGALLELGR